MKITIDASPLLSATETGGARYTRKLIESFSKIHSDNEYILFFQNFNPILRRYYKEKKPYFEGKGFTFKTTFFPRYGMEILWDKIGLKFPPIEFFSGYSDIFHSISYRAPVTRKSRLVSTIFDLTVIKMPELYPDSVMPFYFWVKRAVERSEKIITISESSRKDIAELLEVPADKIKVTYLAHDEKYQPILDEVRIKRVLDKYGINRPYILYVGTLGRNKNIPRLIKAFKIFKSRYNVPHKLVLVGAKAWKFEEITDAINETGLSDDVLLIGYAREDDLPYIYNGCEMFAYISLYEGFGLPVLEAMACGKPSVISNTSSLPEVAGIGGSAILVNPLETEEIAEAFSKIYFSDEDFKKEMSEKALARVAQFSWERCAIETLTVYKSMI